MTVTKYIQKQAYKTSRYFLLHLYTENSDNFVISSSQEKAKVETETKEKHITEIETSTSCCKPEPIRHKKTRRGMNTEIVNKIERRSFRKRVVSPTVVSQTSLVSSQTFRSHFANVINIYMYRSQFTHFVDLRCQRLSIQTNSLA